MVLSRERKLVMVLMIQSYARSLLVLSNMKMRRKSMEKILMLWNVILMEDGCLSNVECHTEVVMVNVAV